MNDQIRLAEAMGRECCCTDYASCPVHTFDPFTYANDDYAVLEWMRDNYSAEEIEVAFDHTGFSHRWAYSTGDYSDGALALLAGRVKDCEDCKEILDNE